MLFVWQLPLSDARLLSAVPSRVRAPDWPTPLASTDFVRGFGPVLRRRRGGHDLFKDESFYADASHALRFDDLAQHRIALHDRSARARIAFRRLLCSDRGEGGVCARVEVGLEASFSRPGGLPRRLSGPEWVKAALQVAELPVRVRRLRQPRPLDATLWNAGPQLARAYLEATSPKGVSTESDRPRLVSAGAPLLLIEYAPGECDQLPAAARPVDAKRVGGLDLRFIWLEYRRREFGVWLLKRDPGRERLTRRLRVGLLRLHAEHQALRAVAGLFLREELTYTRDTAEARLVDRYLRYAMQLLGHDQHGGFSHAALQEVIAAYQSVVSADELALLEHRLDEVRRQVATRVVSYSRAAAPPAAAAALPTPAVEKGDVIRVFVSYSHEDAEYLRPGSFVDYVSGGLKADRFDFWHDTNLRGGDLWDETIRIELDRADIALVLVSQAFLNSRYITDVEATAFIEGMRERGLRIYPVILRPCDWKTKTWLARTQFQPRDGKTVEQHYETRAARDELFLTILHELRDIATELRGARAAAATAAPAGMPPAALPG